MFLRKTELYSRTSARDFLSTSFRRLRWTWVRFALKTDWKRLVKSSEDILLKSRSISPFENWFIFSSSNFLKNSLGTQCSITLFLSSRWETSYKCRVSSFFVRIERFISNNSINLKANSLSLKVLFTQAF